MYIVDNMKKNELRYRKLFTVIMSELHIELLLNYLSFECYMIASSANKNVRLQAIKHIPTIPPVAIERLIRSGNLNRVASLFGSIGLMKFPRISARYPERYSKCGNCHTVDLRRSNILNVRAFVTCRVIMIDGISRVRNHSLNHIMHISPTNLTVHVMKFGHVDEILWIYDSEFNIPN